MSTKNRKSKGQMEEMNTPEQDEFILKKKKIEDILEKALVYAEKLMTHRSEASKQAIKLSDERSKKKESKRKHDREEQQKINKEEKTLQRKSTGTEHEYSYLTIQPSLIQFGVLKNYQMNGLNWLIQLYELRMNGILADDMGLGKTIQTISMIAFLKQFKQISGKFVIIGPLATLNNWLNEFSRWLPCCRVVILYATEEERIKTIKEVIKTDKYDVIITSYEGIKKSSSDLQKINWEYMIVDEAHKLKNESSQLSVLLRQFRTKNRLLLTGTPLQNEIHELISLLNFIMPSIFKDCSTFDELLTTKKKKPENQNEEEGEDHQKTDEAFNENNNISEQDKEKMELVKKLHQIITPFMLRRTKEESLKDLPPKKEIHLYVGLSELQLKMYRNILLNKSIDSVYRGDQQKNYNNMLMQLRKVCVHPYLFDGVEDRTLPEYGDHLVFNSGKMVVLEKLLNKLHKEKEKAHQVLIFTQFTTCLDILEDYMIGKNWGYCRIDGSTEVNDRELMMKEFQKDDSDKFVFLLSTRAGGLGINLTKANFVVIFDSDFNPQIDLQAMDRAYRIGQVREVKVIRLITQYTVEEKIIERQTIKLKLDQLIIQSGRQYQSNINIDQHSIKNITQFGADEIFKAKGSTVSDDDIDMILAKGEQKTQEQNLEIQKLLEQKTKSMFDLEVKSIKCKELFGEDPRLQDEIAIKQAALQAELEEKKRVYEDQFKKSKLIKVKQIALPEYQLYENRQRLEQLLQKEEEYIAKGGIMYKVGMYSDDFIKKMAENNGLQDDEVKEKEELLDQGFPYWDANDYKEFIKACYKFGKGDYEKIANFMNKPLEEVRDYHKAFWSRGDKCISNFNYILKKIEATERNIQTAKEFTEFVKMKMEDSEFKQDNISFDTKLYKKYSSYKNSLERDQLIIYSIYKFGYGEWEKILYEIQTNVFFGLDETFRIMKESDVKARAKQLFNILKAENDNDLLGIREKQALLKKMAEENKKNNKGGKGKSKDGESSNNTVLSRNSNDLSNKIKPNAKEAKKDQKKQKLASEKIDDDIQNINFKAAPKKQTNTARVKKADKENVNQNQDKEQKEKEQKPQKTNTNYSLDKYLKSKAETISTEK